MGVNGVNGQDLAALFASTVKRTPAPQLRSSEAASAAAPQRPAEKPAEEQASQAASTSVAVSGLKPTHTSLRVDRESNRIVARILDENNEVIKQIPPEEMLRIAARFRQIQGLLFDERT